ncbi:hypothetical protein BJ912DRAFT_125859 [Pholiota molesta]|nr:hypothetical protein BJ912DRAFT_125859 [Pholiota molesta]
MPKSVDNKQTSLTLDDSAAIHQASPCDNPVRIATKEDHENQSSTPADNSPSQILLAALQNFINPLIHAANEKNTMDMSQTSLGPEAGKLLTALQEFISSMIIRSRSDNSEGIEVNLKARSRTSTETDSAISDPRPLSVKANLPGGQDFNLQQRKYQNFMQKLQVALRERVFSTMPIRILHWTPKNQNSTLKITLLDRNGICNQIAEKIRIDYSEQKFEEIVERFTARGRHWGSIDWEKILIDNWVAQYTRYAILSHTWLRGSDREVTYDAWNMGQLDARQPGYQKLVNFCKTAWRDHGLAFGWMDTVCINKESSSELDESIRSMYKWYQNATICFTYLAGTRQLADMPKDPWFTRGWTFQELLAPRNTKFYTMDWKKLINSKASDSDKNDTHIQEQIFNATTIEGFELEHPATMPISRKMQLAAKREVMREEDGAYSLMGICDVSMSIAYGEGVKRAFSRLMTKILSSSHNVFDLFNCAQIGNSVIPSTPSAYLARSTKVLDLGEQRPIEPLILTHLGLRIPILLVPGMPADHPNFENNPIGDFYGRVDLPKRWTRDYVKAFCVLDKGLGISATHDGCSWIFDPSTVKSNVTFGVLNVGGDTTNIVVPKSCLAVSFASRGHIQWESLSTRIKRHYRQEPIVFDLLKRCTLDEVEYPYGYSIGRCELAKHGMKLVTMYL